MKFYKVNNEVMAIEQGQEFLVKADWIEMTVEEIELFKNPPKTAEQLAQEAKQAKQLALDSITVTTTSGKVFDGREKDIPLMSGAIDASTVMGITEHPWKLYDNTVAIVTITELKEALVLSMQAIGALKLS